MGAAAALRRVRAGGQADPRVDDGRVGPLEKVRTSAKALSRLEELAVEAAGDAEVDVAVAHLASPDRAEQLAARLGDRLAEGPAGPRGRRSARSARSSAPTSVRAWSPWRSRRRS